MLDFYDELLKHGSPRTMIDALGGDGAPDEDATGGSMTDHTTIPRPAGRR